MDLATLVDLTSQKLGEQRLFYPPAEVVRGGLNPAQRLLCLVYPELLQTRTPVTVGLDMPFLFLPLQLRDSTGALIGNRFRMVRRVVLGDVSQAPALPSPTTGELGKLDYASLAKLMGINDWLRQQGEVRKYWQWGKEWLGLYKRPIAATTITIIADVAPPLLETNRLPDPTHGPVVPVSYHPLLADLGVFLLLVKEGLPQASRSLPGIAEALPRLATMLQGQRGTS